MDSNEHQFDRLGRKTEIVDATGTHALCYHPAGRLLAETNTAGLLAGAGLTNAYDSLGHRTGLSLRLLTSGLSYAYAYDGASRLQILTGAVESATYSYLAKASLVGQIELRHSGAIAMTTTKQYDHLNRLTQVRTVGASPLPLGSFDYAYNDANQRVRVTEADGSAWRYEYDVLGQVKSGQKYWSDGTPVAGQQFQYEFDDIGNRTQTKTGGDARGTGLRSAAYANNLLNQITSREVPGTVDILGIAHPNATLTVNGQSPYRRGEYYDQVLAWNHSNAVVSAWVTNRAVLAGATSNATGRVLLPQTPESPTYDSDGNLTQDGLWNYTWDAENRLISMESRSGVPAEAKRKLEFAYDWQSRRVSKKVSDWNVASNAYVLSTNLLFAYDGWNLVAVLTSDLSPLTSFTWGTDLSGTPQGAGGVGGLLWLTDHAFPTTRYFACYDGNGNVKALVNANDGSVSANYDYGPFGELLRSTGPKAKANPFRFSTKYQDNESDLVYYGYRSYNPSAGRWLSRDPIGERGGVNPYAFVGNRPASRWDRLGLLSLTYANGGFQYSASSDYFYLALGMRFSADDASLLGEAPLVTERMSLSWDVTRCSDRRHWGSSSTRYSAYLFRLDADGNVQGGGEADPAMAGGGYSLYFNPLNISSADLKNLGQSVDGSDFDVWRLLNGQEARTCNATAGRISLAWQYRIVASGAFDNSHWADGLATERPAVPGDPFWIEERHMPYSETSTSIFQNKGPGFSGAYDMTFSWDNCDGKQTRNFSASPPLSVGPSRARPEASPFRDVEEFPKRATKWRMGPASRGGI